MLQFKRISILLITVIILTCFMGCEKKNSTITLPDDEYIRQAKNYCIALPDYTFEQSETVCVDDLINYYCIYELIDESGNFKDCFSDCIQNYPDIIIPKDRVNDRLTELFDVVIDDTDSKWADPQKSDCYNIYIMTRGGMDVPQISDENLTVENGIATFVCKVEFTSVDVKEYEQNGTLSLNDTALCMTVKMTATENGEVKILSVTKQ